MSGELVIGKFCGIGIEHVTCGIVRGLGLWSRILFECLRWHLWAAVRVMDRGVDFDPTYGYSRTSRAAVRHRSVVGAARRYLVAGARISCAHARAGAAGADCG